MTRIQSHTSRDAGGKLAELRAKTDRDLAALLRRTLESSFQLANRAENAEAEAAYAQAATLLCLAAGLTTEEFTSMQSRLRELRAYLDEVTFAGAGAAN